MTEHFKTKYQPIMHRGVPGLTFKNPDDNKGVILDGYVLFKGLNGDTKGIEPGAYANITWKAYGQYFLNQKTVDNPENLILALNAVINPGEHYEDIFSEIVNGLSQEYLFDYKEFTLKTIR